VLTDIHALADHFLMALQISTLSAKDKAERVGDFGHAERESWWVQFVCDRVRAGELHGVGANF